MNRRDFLRLAGGTAAALALGRTKMFAQTVPTGPGAIRFAVIGDFGQAPCSPPISFGNRRELLV
jgi:hypothetical protein